MTARNVEGEEFFNQSRIYMPHPARFGITDHMGRGPYEKSGMVRDTGLPPLQPVKETFEIIFPFKKGQRNKNRYKTLLSDTMEVEVKLLYLPYGEIFSDHFVWKISKQLVTIAPPL